MSPPNRKFPSISLVQSANIIMLLFPTIRYVQQISQARQVQAEKQQLEELIRQSSTLSNEYFKFTDQPPRRLTETKTLNSQLQECYSSLLNEILVEKCTQINSSSEQRGVTASEVLESIEKFVSTDYACIHEEFHQNGNESCGNIENSPNTLVISIEEKLERISAMLEELNLMASDVKNGNETISKDELKRMLQKLRDHQCQVEKKREKDASENDEHKSGSGTDFLALNEQLMRLEEAHSKYNRDRKEKSVRPLCKLKKARNFVEQ